MDPEEIIDQPVEVVSLSGKELYKNIVRTQASQYGWDTGANWEALETLVYKESSWNPNAQNPVSTAFGLFQFLDATWTGYGCTKSGDVEHQAECGLKYIAKRYGTPSKALEFHLYAGWY